MIQSKALSVRHQRLPLTIELMIALAGGCMLAIFSKLAMPLPFTPIPMTLQTFAVFLLGGILGSRRGVYSVLAYLAQGCIGLPVFAGGVANPFWLLDMKAGFLISFIPAAFIIGKIFEKRLASSTSNESIPRAGILHLAVSLIFAQLTIFSVGMAWLSLYLGIAKAFIVGVLPFFSGAVIKIIAATLILKSYSIYRLRSKNVI
ncbi:MAG: biotin transporter BioY [Anaerolineae bacterium]